MRLARVQKDGQRFYAVVEPEVVRRIKGSPWGRFTATDDVMPLNKVTFLPPASRRRSSA